MEEIDFLVKNIGTYNKCEVVEIFGYDKVKREAFNIYTVVVFENTKQIEINGLITDKLEEFQTIFNIKWGIKRRIVNINDAKSFFELLKQENIFKIDEELSIGELKYLSMQFIQADDSFVKPQLNYILKNNFYNGSYILEFFDEEKKNNQFLLDNPVLLNEFSERIGDLVPIKLANVSDRLGNIVFQFPINIFKLEYSTKRTDNPPRFSGLNVEIFPKNKNYNINNLEIRVYENNDNIVTRQHFIMAQKNITEILLDDCFGTTIEVVDKSTSLLVYKNKFSIMKEFDFKLNLISPQNRVFKLENKINKIPIEHNSNSSVGNSTHKKKEFNEWIHDRKYEQELKYLEQNKSFIQYYGKKDEDKTALNDIRYLINKYGQKGVYLWDPYLSSVDIKKTLYFSKFSYVDLKAITGLKQGSNTIKNVFENLQWSKNNTIKVNRVFFDYQYTLIIFALKSQKQQTIIDMQNELSQDDKQFLFLNLEVRGRYGTSGYDFHDRFLIFPLEKPKVWSLGISINQLGKAHHILQEVKNAQHILNAFNQLWTELDKKECLVWKSN